MNKDQIAALIAQTRQEHQHDKDGGYNLVFAILRLSKKMEDSGRKALQEHLLERIDEEDPKFWGIALEVLVQAGSFEAATSLEKMLRDGNRSQEWVDQVVLDLLRMGYDRPLDLYLSNIQFNLSANRPVCAALAHLYKVAPDISIRMSAQFFAKSLFSGGNVFFSSHCVAAFVYTYPKESENALLELVKETSGINPKAGKKLRSDIADYLTKPWLPRDLGQEKVARLKSMFNQ
jgi:hypothetical protein